MISFIIVLIINFFRNNTVSLFDTFMHDDFYDEYKKWHKRNFASSHKTWHNS